MTRVFVAVKLPFEAKEKITYIGKTLLKTNSRLNMVNPDISHITLKFIGDVDDKKLDEIIKFLSGVKFSTYPICLKGVSLNSKKLPRIVWINGSDKGETSELAGIIEEGLFSLGIEKEKRPFKIHATIARIKEWDSSLIPAIKLFENEDICEYDVCGFKLKKSTLTPTGPIYEDIMEVSF
ncbi:MAG: RNA 2',3'-cyclic phosphodiesterase [Methanomicrobium sp.]|nr:RNA 2',3'-cyclic phosphodiesterase [Methanomicrobium sp.]